MQEILIQEQDCSSVSQAIVPKITAHFKERFKERTGLKVRGIKRFLELALERGLRFDNIDDKQSFLYKYLLGKAVLDDRYAILYNNFVLILSDDNTAITIIRASKQLNNYLKKYGISPNTKSKRKVS